MMGRYGTGMRDCCDSPVGSGYPHIVGCVNAHPQDSSEVVARLIEWLQKRGEPNSGIRYDGSYSGDGVRRQARVELHGRDATFVASHFHGSGATQLAALISSLVADRERLDTENTLSMKTIADERERADIAERNRNAARENFLTMQGVAAKLLEDANDYKAAMLTNYERALTAERLLAEARAALAFYADLNSYRANGHPQIDADTKPILSDLGAKARASIGGMNGQ